MADAEEPIDTLSLLNESRNQWMRRAKRAEARLARLQASLTQADEPSAPTNGSEPASAASAAASSAKNKTVDKPKPKPKPKPKNKDKTKKNDKTKSKSKSKDKDAAAATSSKRKADTLAPDADAAAAPPKARKTPKCTVCGELLADKLCDNRCALEKARRRALREQQAADRLDTNAQA